LSLSYLSNHHLMMTMTKEILWYREFIIFFFQVAFQSQLERQYKVTAKDNYKYVTFYLNLDDLCPFSLNTQLVWYLKGCWKIYWWTETELYFVQLLPLQILPNMMRYEQT
jgi:hypothetical protein